MKLTKIITVILIWMLLLNMAACNTPEPENTQPVILQSSTSGTSFEGVEIGLYGIDRTAQETVIQIAWKNNTDYNVLYGDVFWLQVLKDGQWESMQPKENTGFHTIGYSLQAGSSSMKNYTTSWIYGTLQPGTYRFLTNCHVYENTEGTACDLSVEFTLGTLPDETEGDGYVNAQSPYMLPPALQLAIGTASGAHAAVGYSWNYATGDGQMATVSTSLTDANHIKNNLIMLETTMTDAVIDFDDWPDDLMIRCWSPSAFGHPNGESEAVMIWNNNCFALKPATSGGYIYEITATWSQEGSLHYGTATYYVYIASYPVMPIQPRT